MAKHAAVVAEVELDQMSEEPGWGVRRDAVGVHSLSAMGAGGSVRRCDVL